MRNLTPRTFDLAGAPATSVARRILADAQDAGLHPALAKDHPRGITRVIVDAGGVDGLFGCIDLGAISGRIARAYLCHGNHGVERRYDSVAEVRAVISSWAAVQRTLADERLASLPATPESVERGAEPGDAIR